MAGIYHPVCPAYCRDSNAWKTQLVGGSCGVLALALVLGAVVWIVRYVCCDLLSPVVSIILIDICKVSCPASPAEEPPDGDQ